MIMVDYLVIGSGLTGSTIARLLADHGREVLVLERRKHLGGNVHDFTHASGIQVHTYGPHYFRCASREIWEFVNRFSPFYDYRASVRTLVDGQYVNWPLNRRLLKAHGKPARCRRTMPANFEEACLRLVPPEIYERFIKGYTRRQWGIDPALLDRNLADRIRVNKDHEDLLTPDSMHQGLPAFGYARLMSNLLAGIPCVRSTDYLKFRGEYGARKMLIFTGPIDEFFGFDLGRLMYRGQQRLLEFFPGRDWHQPCGQVNHPDAAEDGSIRTIEWKHLMPATERATVNGTIVTNEYPFTPKDPNDFEYSVPTPLNQRLYEQYRRRVGAIPKLIACGRLAECRYLDMDHAIEAAMAVARRLLRTSRSPPTARERARAFA